MADEAVEIAGAALALIEPDRANVPDSDKGAAELLNEGLRQALIVGRDICRSYDPEADIKERRLVSDTAGWITRAGIRIAEGEFRARKDDTLIQMLKLLAAEKQAKPKK